MRPALLVIWAAVGLLLLIACTNVANLFLTRSVTRQREFTIRAALGASRACIIRQALAETMMLGLALGGAFGVMAANWGVSLLRIIGPANLPRLQEIHINPAVLAFAVGISLLTGAITGLFSVFPCTLQRADSIKASENLRVIRRLSRYRRLRNVHLSAERLPVSLIAAGWRGAADQEFLAADPRQPGVPNSTRADCASSV